MVQDGESCPGCGLANYSGLCPVCRGDYPAYQEELEPYFGPWFDNTKSSEEEEANV